MNIINSPATGRKRVKLSLVVLIWLVLLLSTSLPACTEKGSTELISLKIVDLPYITYLPFYIAQEEGFFAEQGLNAEFVKFTSVTQALPLLIQGDLDVAAGSISAGLFNAIAQDMNIKIVASHAYIDAKEGSQALVAKKDLYDSGVLDTVAELKGKQIFMPCTACIDDFATEQILKTESLTLNDVVITKMSRPDIVTALGSGSIEVATLGALQIVQVKSLGCAEVLALFNDAIPGFHVSYVMFGPTLLEDNPDIGKKFMVAYLKGVRQRMEGKTERNLEIAEKYTGMDRDTLLSSPWTPQALDGRMNIENVLAFQDWAYDSGYIDKKIAEEQLIDTTFIDYANKVLE
ncbi:MAG: hypothetical protein FJ004_00765 [Chloroflexi bacterium]|nr:hypothetical protein [Chloroflexota bacterium]